MSSQEKKERASLKLTMRKPWKFVGMAAFLAGAAALPAWAGEPISCTPEMLDVRVLPLLESESVLRVQTLIIELQNRSQSLCKLPDAAVELLPKSGADELTTRFTNDPDTSANRLSNRDNQLFPLDVAHLLVSWPSRAAWNMFEGCFDRDRLVLSIGWNQPPILSVEHLWARLCDRAYISGYRAGRYADEGLPTEWLQRFRAAPGDFAAPRVLSGNAAGKEAISASTANERAMLQDYFELSLDLPRVDFNCPFVVLRKREADGTTTVYLNHCAMTTAEELKKSGLQQPNWTARLNLPALAEQPQNTGRVEYEVISRIEHEGKPAYASALASIRIRDPELPSLPATESPLPDCKAEQLEWKTLPPLDRGKFHEAHVYQAANTSEQACAVGGVPQITFSHPEGQSYTWIPTPCPNCEDSLFQPRPSGWIDLSPGDSAHFLVGAFRYNTEAGHWRLICSQVETITVKFSEEVIKLPFEAGTCAGVNISAWRAGVYDGDPMNLEYDRARAKQKQDLEAHAVPAECGKNDFGTTGRPVFFPAEKDLRFGISVEQEHFLKGTPVGVHIWTANTSDKAIIYMTCPALLEMALYDAYGHRLFTRAEEKMREQHKASVTHVMVCSATFQISVPPHSCSASPDKMILSDQYSLPPGEYVVMKKEPEPAAGASFIDAINKTKNDVGLVISVDQP